MTVSVYLQLLASIDTILDGTSVVFIFCPPLGTTCISRETVLFTGLHHHFLSLHQNVTFSVRNKLQIKKHLQKVLLWKLSEVGHHISSNHPIPPKLMLHYPVFHRVRVPRATKRMRLDGWLAQL